MVRFGSKQFGSIQTIGYGSITVIKLLIQFTYHVNGLVNFNSV